MINFQSVRKKGKNIDVLVESTHPDIIFGTETWHSGDIPSTYFFNPQLGYTVHRHDRPNDPHGGVLIAVKNDLELTNIQKGKEVELIAGTVNISKTKKMLLCSYYRPPDKTSEEYLNMVKEEFTDLRKKYKNAVFIIGGDFNLPDIDWNKNTVTNKVSKGAKIRNRYNQVPHLTQDTNGKVTNSQQTPQTRAKRSALSQQVTTKHK